MLYILNNICYIIIKSKIIMEGFMETKKDKFPISAKHIAIISMIILVISLIPILTNSIYNHPSADDYNYSKLTFNALKEGGILNLISNVGKTVVKTYISWQGTYSATAIMSLQPAIWGQQFYFLGTFIIVFALVFSVFYLLKKLIIDILHLHKENLLIIASALLIISIQTVPSLVQGLYWWNGASYYTLFYAFLLVELGLLIKYYQKKTKLTFVLISLFNILIAGGNFITALNQIILLTLLNIYLLYKKKDKSALLFLCLSIIGLLISALAPGNAIRGASIIGYSPIKAILLSFVYAAKDIILWTKLTNILFIIFILFFLFPSYQKINCKFSYPILFSLITFGIYSALYTPTLYAMASVGEGRLTNIIYYYYFDFMIINFYYWIGFIRWKFLEYKIVTPKFETKLELIVKHYSIPIIIFFFLLSAATLYINRESLTSFITAKDQIENSSQTFDKEYKKRILLYEDDKLKEIHVKEFTVKPLSLFYSDISEDKDSWLNTPITKIYHKKYIVVDPIEEK